MLPPPPLWVFSTVSRVAGGVRVVGDPECVTPRASRSWAAVKMPRSPSSGCTVAPESAAGPPPSERTTCDAMSMMTRSPGSVWARIATWLVIDPVGM